MKKLYVIMMLGITIPAFAQLPTIKAAAEESKYKDWGKSPFDRNDTEGPVTWTFPHPMCNSVSAVDIKTSSDLAPQGKYNYTADNIIDDNPTTAWVEGKSDYGIGEYIELYNWVPMTEGTIYILNGFQFNKTIWEENSRVKTLKISINGKDVCYIELEDKMGIQTFLLPEKLEEPATVRFTITDVYKGTKYKDTAISGIFSCGG